MNPTAKAMTGSLDNPPVVIRARRWPRPGRLLAILGVIAVVGWFGVSCFEGAALYLTRRHPTLFGAIVSVALVAVILGLPIYTATSVLLRAIYPERLELSPAGLVFFTPVWRTKRFRWDEVANFRVVNYATIVLVGFNSSNGRVFASRFKAATGADGYLAGALMFDDLETICELLNDAHARWAGADDGARSPPS